MTGKNKLKKITEEYGGIITTKVAEENNIHREYLGLLVKEGKLDRVSYGVYASADAWEDVRKTHAEINGKKYKPVKDIKKWYEKLHTDSAEYKAYGNGLALPNAEFVLNGIAEQGAKTLGSLFDGIGGFPLAGVLNGIIPLWSSEIEPYPIAVTVSRFGTENAPTESQLR